MRLSLLIGIQYREFPRFQCLYHRRDLMSKWPQKRSNNDEFLFPLQIGDKIFFIICLGYLLIFLGIFIPKDELEGNAGLTCYLGKIKLAVGDSKAAKSYFEKSVKVKDLDATEIRSQEESKLLLSKMNEK